MLARGDWVTLHVNGVRYFDKPPVLYWLMALSFSVAGATRVRRAALARAGRRRRRRRHRASRHAARRRAGRPARRAHGRGQPRDLPVRPHREARPAVHPLHRARLRRLRPGVSGRRAAGRSCSSTRASAWPRSPRTSSARSGRWSSSALFFWLTRERPVAPWVPWWGVAPAARHRGAVVRGGRGAAIRGFLWYTIVDNHVLNFTRQRVFPDEDVPLGPLEFLGVTCLAFLPWALAVPWALARAFRRPVGGRRRARSGCCSRCGRSSSSASSRCRRSSCRTTGCPRFPRWRCWSRASGTSRSTRARLASARARCWCRSS